MLSWLCRRESSKVISAARDTTRAVCSRCRASWAYVRAPPPGALPLLEARGLRLPLVPRGRLVDVDAAALGIGSIAGIGSNPPLDVDVDVDRMPRRMTRPAFRPCST